MSETTKVEITKDGDVYIGGVLYTRLQSEGNEGVVRFEPPNRIIKALSLPSGESR